MTQSTSPAHLTAGTLHLGPVELSVSDLNRSVPFYRTLLGLTVLEQTQSSVTLGLPGQPLLNLNEQRGALPSRPTSPGLYHFAVLLPTRADLSRWAQHAARLGLRLGQSDHLVSEAFYLNDPDGHGIEVYRDRPAHEWKWRDGQVQMAGDPIDLNNLLAEPGADAPYTTLPAGTVMGHVHLRVTDLARTETFYRDVLGFDIVSRWPGALFVSVSGYHHHLGLNVWQSQNGSPAPQEIAQLRRVNLHLPRRSDLHALAARLQTANVTFTLHGNSLDVRDPAGNTLHFQAGEDA